MNKLQKQNQALSERLLMAAGILLILAVMGMLACCTGCANLMKAVEDKQVNFDSQVYGFKVSTFDPTTGSMSPVGEFGFGSLIYRSIPIEKGQPFFAKYTVKSLWSSAPASETIIWIGRAHEKGALEFEAVPEGMMVISKNGITVGDKATLKFVPDAGYSYPAYTYPVLTAPNIIGGEITGIVK